MQLTKQDALVCAKAFKDYFGNFGRIDEYMRDQKLNDLASMPTSLFPPEDDAIDHQALAPEPACSTHDVPESLDVYMLLQIAAKYTPSEEEVTYCPLYPVPPHPT